VAESKGGAKAAERSAPGSDGGAVSKTSDRSATRRTNPLSRLIRFFREVVAELRKVIWPTRKELISYTTVVIVFVSIMITIVWLLDYGFAKAVWVIFGKPGDA